MYDILDKINSPQDVRKLDMSQLRELCSQIRSYMIECCAVNPGHLGSSLGAVELIVGMHYVFDTPKDKLIYDVSHQAYAHKIITGRREKFRTIRTAEGICGFTRRTESPYDAFGAGHSSTSISAAFGMAQAARAMGRDEKVVALIGDGSLSGGLAFEGLNNAGDSDTDLLVVVNDNNMSIDNNIGALHHHLLRLTTSPFYNTMKSKLWEFIGDRRIRKSLQNKVIQIKSSLVQHSGGDLFEALGFRYFGPIDGNDIETVVKSLSRLKDLHGPRILHTITKKGKGYDPAEKDQTAWHAPGQFDPTTGERLKKPTRLPRYQDVFGHVLLTLAKRDERIVGITPAMASGCGMNILAEQMPDRVYDVGIAEEHAVTFSAGLCAGGMKPFCNIYSSFSQRAYDQIIHDVALQGLPVVICLDRAGLVGEDGATHHGTFDMTAYRSIPGCIIASPRNEKKLQDLMYSASRSESGPYIIRYPRGNAEGVKWVDVPMEQIETGKGEKLREGRDIAIVAMGHCACRAMEAAEKAAASHGISVTVWDAVFLKPFDPEISKDILSGKYSAVITVEDGALCGGLMSQICETTAQAGAGIKVFGLGIPDKFIHHGTQSGQRSECGIGTDEILQKILEISK